MESFHIENKIKDRIASLFVIDAVLLGYIYVVVYFIPNDLYISIDLFIYIAILLTSSHILIILFLWPNKIIISEDGITLVYKHHKNKKILWEDILEIKISRWIYYIRYRKSHSIDYIPLTIKSIRTIKQEWEKWKARRNKYAK